MIETFGGIILIIIACWAIMKSCDWFETATDFLGRNLSDGLKGMTLNAIGSSMPELLTTVFWLVFALDPTKDMGTNMAASISGDAGSAIFNSIVIPFFIVLTVTTLAKTTIRYVKVQKRVILRDGLFLLAAEVLLLFMLSNDIIDWKTGAILVLFYFVYIGYSFWRMKLRQKQEGTPDVSEDDEEDDEPETWFERFLLNSKGEKSNGKGWMLLGIATLAIAASCAVLVHGTEMFAAGTGIPLIYVSLILVAAASSLPDTIISMRDAKKGNHDDAMSNVLGSNIFDITFSFGFPVMMFCLITGIRIDFTTAGAELLDMRFILLIVTALTVGVFYFAKNGMGKLQMWLLAALYTVFVVYCIGSSMLSQGVDNSFTKGIKETKEVLHKHLEEPLKKGAHFMFPFNQKSE